MGGKVPRALAGLIIGVVLLAVAPAAAHATPLTSVVLYSDPTDSVGGGVQRLYTPANATIELKNNGGGVTVYTTSGGVDFDLSFAAGADPLTPGVYPSGGVIIDGDHRSCNMATTRMEVKDIGRDASGTVNRLWVLFEQHCGGNPQGLFGEVRVGEEVPEAPATPETAIVRWPVLQNGGIGSAVPVRLLAAQGVHVNGVAIDGTNRGDFEIASDGCTGQSLPAGGGCDVSVRFKPTTPGTRTAVLDLVDSGGHHYATELQGFSHGGITRATMHSDPGDYIGGGADYTFAPAVDTIVSNVSGRRVYFGINYADWNGFFAVPKGAAVAPGTYENPGRFPSNGDGPGMAVDGSGRSCNTVTGRFTIKEVTFEADGSLRSFGATFEQHCDGNAPALTGEFDYRFGDSTPLAPWMGGAGGPDSSNGVGTGGGAVTPVTLRAKSSRIVFGRGASLPGTATAGAPVELQAAPFPYLAYAPVATTTADPAGRFSFHVKPDRNTRYRAVSGGATSPERTVFVVLAGAARRVRVGARRERVTLTLLGPVDIPYAGRRVFFYKGRKRVGSARLKGLKPGLLRAHAVLHMRGRPLVCMPKPVPDAWGSPARIDRVCGARRLKLSRGA